LPVTERAKKYPTKNILSLGKLWPDGPYEREVDMLIEEAKRLSVGTVVEGLDVIVTTSGAPTQIDKTKPKRQAKQGWRQTLGLTDTSGHIWGIATITKGNSYVPIRKSVQVIIEAATVDEFTNKRQEREKRLIINKYNVPTGIGEPPLREEDKFEGVLDPRVEQVLQKYNIAVTEAVWPMKRKNKNTGITKTTWLIYHRYCEEIAAKAHVTFEQPELVPTNSDSKSVAVLVTGRLGYAKEWSYGEASPDNNKKVPYPFAMAEKRAKDRVILKLVGLHGFIYGEDEEDWNGAK
jgi:hypothetical protein